MSSQRAIMKWLLDSDPSIRWQVMRDLVGEPEGVVTAERLRVASEGWGARLLELQSPDGHWGNGDVEVGLKSLNDLPYVMGLVRQAFEKQMGSGNDA